MRMRKIPQRGEKYYRLKDRQLMTIIELVDSTRPHSLFLKVILPNGKIGSISKDDLDLPIIQTKEYEKL